MAYESLPGGPEEIKDLEEGNSHDLLDDIDEDVEAFRNQPHESHPLLNNNQGANFIGGGGMQGGAL